MTDADIDRLAQVIRAAPASDAKSAIDFNKVVMLLIGGFLSVVGSLVLAIAGFYVIGTLQKSDEAALTIASITQKMGSMENLITTLTTAVNDLRKDVSTSRYDPFTGTDGKKLQEKLESVIESEVDSLESSLGDVEFRVRELERTGSK